MTIYRNHSYKHGIGWSIWHIEFVTKYRHRIFRDAELKSFCGLAFEEAAKRYNFVIFDYEIQEDHVHLLVHLRPSMSPAKTIGLLKGYSGRLLFALAEGKLAKYYWLPKGQRSLCGTGKFFASVGHITLEKAKSYLENQETHHAKRELLMNPHPLWLGSFKNTKVFYKTTFSAILLTLRDMPV